MDLGGYTIKVIDGVPYAHETDGTICPVDVEDVEREEYVYLIKIGCKDFAERAYQLNPDLDEDRRDAEDAEDQARIDHDNSLRSCGTVRGYAR